MAICDSFSYSIGNDSANLHTDSTQHPFFGIIQMAFKFGLFITKLTRISEEIEQSVGSVILQRLNFVCHDSWILELLGMAL